MLPMKIELICPYSKELLDQIDGHPVTVKVSNLSDICPAAQSIRTSGNVLSNIIVEVEKPLSAITFQQDWSGIPISLFVPEMGSFKEIGKQIPEIRELKTHIYLPAENTENLTSSRILASLGITCCLVFGNQAPDWDLLSDLMTYAILGNIPHAPIEPFNYIADHYAPENNVDWGSIYFDDPLKCLHMDANGKVSLSHRDLINSSFIAENISMIHDPIANEGYRNGINSWRQFFLDNHPCTLCKGWKICLGRFLSCGNQTKGCSAFIVEMLAVVEQFRTQHQQDVCQGNLS